MAIFHSYSNLSEGNQFWCVTTHGCHCSNTWISLIPKSTYTISDCYFSNLQKSCHDLTVEKNLDDPTKAKGSQVIKLAIWRCRRIQVPPNHTCVFGGSMKKTKQLLGYLHIYWAALKSRDHSGRSRKQSESTNQKSILWLFDVMESAGLPACLVDLSCS